MPGVTVTRSSEVPLQTMLDRFAICQAQRIRHARVRVDFAKQNAYGLAPFTSYLPRFASGQRPKSFYVNLDLLPGRGEEVRMRHQ